MQRVILKPVTADDLRAQLCPQTSPAATRTVTGAEMEKLMADIRSLEARLKVEIKTFGENPKVPVSTHSLASESKGQINKTVPAPKPPSPTVQLQTLTEKRMAESGGKLSYAEALASVCEENPRLYSEHAAAILHADPREILAAEPPQKVGPSAPVIDPNSPAGQIQSRVEKKMSEQGLSYEQSLRTVIRENPTLYERHINLV